MGELTPGMKKKLHELVDESDTETIFDLVNAIRESDGDQMFRVVVDFTQPQFDFLGDCAEELHVPGIRATVIRNFVDAARVGATKAALSQLM